MSKVVIDMTIRPVIHESRARWPGTAAPTDLHRGDSQTSLELMLDCVPFIIAYPRSQSGGLLAGLVGFQNP